MTSTIENPLRLYRPAPVPPPASYQPAPISLSSAIARVSVTIGVLGLWSVLFVVGLSSLSAARTQQVMYGDLRSNLAQEVVPFGSKITPGTPLGLIESPAINLRYVFVEGTSSGDLRAGPGHVRSTPLPGQAGVSQIFGRALGYGGPFAHITDLQTGDFIIVTTQQGTFTYAVEDVRYAGDAEPAPPGPDGSVLTLVTAEGVSWRSGWVPNQAVYVDATLQGPTSPTPSGRIAAAQVPKAEAAMQGDPGALQPLVLWVQLLLIVSVGLVWGQTRWGPAQTWLVGAPIAIAVLWGASQTAIQLLPNLI